MPEPGSSPALVVQPSRVSVTDGVSSTPSRAQRLRTETSRSASPAGMIDLRLESRPSDHGQLDRGSEHTPPSPSMASSSPASGVDAPLSATVQPKNSNSNELPSARNTSLPPSPPGQSRDLEPSQVELPFNPTLPNVHDTQMLNNLRHLYPLGADLEKSRPMSGRSPTSPNLQPSVADTTKAPVSEAKGEFQLSNAPPRETIKPASPSKAEAACPPDPSISRAGNAKSHVSPSRSVHPPSLSSIQQAPVSKQGSISSLGGAQSGPKKLPTFTKTKPPPPTQQPLRDRASSKAYSNQLTRSTMHSSHTHVGPTSSGGESSALPARRLSDQPRVPSVLRNLLQHATHVGDHYLPPRVSRDLSLSHPPQNRAPNRRRNVSSYPRDSAVVIKTRAHRQKLRSPPVIQPPKPILKLMQRLSPLCQNRKRRAPTQHLLLHPQD
jgi:hypothetical protein